MRAIQTKAKSNTVTTQEWGFSVKFFSVNVAKSTVSCGFGHIYWRNP